MKNKSSHVILASATGTILEWYDFSLYAYLAPILSKVFFPNNDYVSSLLLAYSVFAIGYLVRPIGAILFSHLGDRIGRKKVLVTSIFMIANATCLIGLLPNYNQIGIYAALLLILLRIIQGFAIGGETIGAGTFVIESIQIEKRGFLTSLVWAGSGLGMLLSSSVITIINYLFTQDQLLAWAWRIPFLLGGLTGLIGLYFRQLTNESSSFKSLQYKNKLVKFPLKEVIKNNKNEIGIATGLYALSAIITYLLLVYMPVFVSKVTTIPFNLAMVINTIMLGLSVVLVPIIGLISDNIGRKNILLYSAIAILIFSYPLFLMVVSGSIVKLIIAQLMFTTLGACFQGAITGAILEMFPTHVRFSGAALSYNLSYSILGSTTPAIAVYMMSIFHMNTAPCFYLIGGTIIGIVAAFAMQDVLCEESLQY